MCVSVHKPQCAIHLACGGECDVVLNGNFKFVRWKHAGVVLQMCASLNCSLFFAFGEAKVFLCDNDSKCAGLVLHNRLAITAKCFKEGVISLNLEAKHFNSKVALFQ